MSSLNTINFAIRPNKCVERKLIFEALRTLAPTFDLTSYKYIGLGGIWFTDFVLAHRILRIEKMHSIEEHHNAAERARFNRPYAPIEVHAGLTTDILPTLRLNEERSIVWLDYDSDITGPILEDIPILMESLPAGSIVLLTVNAEPRSLGKTLEERCNIIAQRAAGYYDEPLPSNFFDLVPQGYAANLAKILFARLTRDTSQRTGHTFIPMFNIYYADNATMITVGGMIVDGNVRDMLNQTRINEQAAVTGAQQFPIELPVLTRREKLYLDRLLPANPPLDDRQLTALQQSAASSRERMMLRKAEVTSYEQFYRYYPVYSETDF